MTIVNRLIGLTTCTMAVVSFLGCKVEISRTSGTKTETTSTQASKADSPEPGGPVRIMSYNIQFFNAEATNHGNRVQKIETLLADIKPTVVGVQEVDDRRALELIFPPDRWTIIIDDDSDDKQDTAFAVRRPWRVTNVPDDLDADDEQFLAADQQYESYFPNRRDALFVQVQSPNGTKKLTAVNIHAKARVGGRTGSDGRREGASRVLIDKFRTMLEGQNIVLMGDFNDTPDDASLNILETGDPDARGRIENDADTFMVNLAEPLWAKGMVTEGASAKRLDHKTGLINNIYPEARQRNQNTRGRDAGTGPVLLDQILVSQSLKAAVVGSAETIYRNPLALEGPGFSRPSDHLPVYVDLNLDKTH